MVRNIIVVLVLACISVPSWQIGTILIQKTQVSNMIQEKANSIKRYDNEDLVKQNLKSELEILELPAKFRFEKLERRKVKISYKYQAKASIFNYTYYEVDEDLEAVTEDGKFDRS
jgi:Tfp pilus assembly protein PilE